ncbi:NAD(P)-binding protein [Lophiostoma macrostomum CBS 122681]|uniref:NAD(P)-binding protein n=1 Tax=Lophiostoma macrostomum CBS 122681 TaxID=1314788 RepID=A0A6A6T3Y4_9PLEO|nr:NAD(P)-binding protein [Lophiostoma macrostomum CBS 122681]
MTSLSITESSIPDLTGKTAVITGGARGIGLGAVQVLLDHNARVFVLDVLPIADDVAASKVTFIQTDTSSWLSLVDAFTAITTEHGSKIDIAIANAGVWNDPYLEDCLTPAPTDAAGWSALKDNKPATEACVEVNLKGTMNFVILASKVMKTQEKGGSIVVTSSSTAYFAEQQMPVYTATKAALVGLVSALRSTLPLHKIAISAVCPSAVETAMIPTMFIEALKGLGLPIATTRHVGLALVYSATATQNRRVEDYGKDKPVPEDFEERWNGRVIHAIGEEYWEVEEKLAETRGVWWGEKNLKLTEKQRVVSDLREV